MLTTIKLFRHLWLASLILALLAMQGCGGGGGGGGQPGTTDPLTTTNTTNTTTTTTIVSNDPVPAPNATVVNTPQSARHHNVSLAFDDSGNGIAVWETGQELGIKLVYSLYDAGTGSWSQEAVLAGSTNIYYFDTFNFSVASNGSGFAVSWEQAHDVYDEHLYVAVYRNGAWSATTRIDNIDADSVAVHKLAASSSGYMLVWEQSYHTFYSRYANGSWSGANSVATVPGQSSIFDLASDGSNFLLAYCDALFCSYTSTTTSSVAFVNGSWGQPVYMTDYDNIDLVSNGTGYAAFWKQGAALYWSQYSGASAWTTPELLVSTAYSPSFASNGSGYALVYSSGGSTSSAATIYSAIYDGSSWAAANPVAAAIYPSKLAISASGTDYGVSWLASDNTATTTPNLYAAVIASGAPQAPMLLEQNAQEVSYPAMAGTGSGYAYAWIQYDGVATEEVYTRSYGAAGLNAQSSLLQLAHDSPASRPVIAVNGTGQKLAVWKQEYFDPTASAPQYLYKSGLFASVYDSGSWGPAHLIQKYGLDPKVVSNGQSFLVTFYSVSSPGGSLYATVYANGAWDTPKALDGTVYESSLATNGSNYVVAWESNSSGDWGLYTQMYDDVAGWDASYSRHDDTTNSSYVSDIISNGSGYAMVWKEADSNAAIPYQIYAIVYDSVNGWIRTLIQSNGHSIITPDIATDGSGYMLAWEDLDTGELLTSQYSNQAWQATQRIDSGTASGPSIASNGSGYAVVWGGYPAIYANVFDGSSWSGQTLIGEPAYSAGSSIVANAQGYMVHWSVADFDNSRYAIIHDGTAWQQAPVLLGLNTSLEAVRGNGQTYAMVWQETGADGKANLAYRLFDGTSWQVSTLLENSNHELPFIEWVNVITEGSGYSAVWAQPHGGYEDPVVPKVWYKSFGN